MSYPKPSFLRYQALSMAVLLMFIIPLPVGKSHLLSQEGITCTPEPTEMAIGYGGVIICAIDTEGDTDLFHFEGSSGDAIIVQADFTSGTMRPCIELIAPDSTHISACENAFTNRIDARLTQSGTYTVQVDVFFGGQGAYVLALERLIDPSPDAVEIKYGQLLEGQIDPQGELDVYYFEGVAGEAILLQTAYQSGSLRPCIQLVKPNNDRIQACENAFSNRIDTVLDQSGTYAILVEVFFRGSGNYTLILERLIPPSPQTDLIPFGYFISNRIDPVGDLDLFQFNGTLGENISLTIHYKSGTFRPCIQLIQPDNIRMTACNNAFSNQINLTLGQTGTYAVLTDVFFVGTGGYSLCLLRNTGECKYPVFLPVVIQ